MGEEQQNRRFSIYSSCYQKTRLHAGDESPNECRSGSHHTPLNDSVALRLVILWEYKKCKVAQSLKVTLKTQQFYMILMKEEVFENWFSKGRAEGRRTRRLSAKLHDIHLE